MALLGEVVWSSRDFDEDGSLVLVDGPRSRVSVGRCAGSKVCVLKRFKGATAVADLDAASGRFDRERRAAWALSAGSAFVLRPLATIVDAPVMGLVLPFCGRFRSLDLVLHGSARHDWSPRGDLGPLAPTALWRALLAYDVARGLAHAHATGVVVRDVKPANVLVGDDGVGRLADFEISLDARDGAGQPQQVKKTRGRGGPASKPRRVFEGTPQYVSPEQVRAYDSTTLHGVVEDPMRGASSSASDVYALAVTMNEIATGVVPFTDVERSDAQLQTVVEVAYSTSALCRAVAAEGARPRLFAARRDFGGDAFPDLIARAWAQAPADRPAAAAVAEALRRCFEALDGFADGADPAGRAALVRRDDEPLWRLPPKQGDGGESSGAASFAPLSAEERAAVDLLARSRRSSDRRCAWGVELSPGPRDAMEDRADGVEFGASSSCHVVTDGHGGARVAELAVGRLPALTARALLRRAAAGAVADLDVCAALREAFLALEGALGEDDAGGACVVVALFLGDALWVAHCGDCRAVLDRDGDATWTWSRSQTPSPDALRGVYAGGVVQLTRDHVPGDVEEEARVVAAGGALVTLGDGKRRVRGTTARGGLAVSRALGDARSYAGVSPVPDVCGPVSISRRDATLRAGPGCAVGNLQTAPISVVFHSFRLSFRRAIIPRSGLEESVGCLERARAERPR